MRVAPSVVIFWLAAIACAVGQFSLLRSFLSGRAPGLSDTRRARLAEIAWVALPALALLAVLIATWRAIGGQPVAPANAFGILS